MSAADEASESRRRAERRARWAAAPLPVIDLARLLDRSRQQRPNNNNNARLLDAAGSIDRDSSRASNREANGAAGLEQQLDVESSLSEPNEWADGEQSGNGVSVSDEAIKQAALPDASAVDSTHPKEQQHTRDDKGLQLEHVDESSSHVLLAAMQELDAVEEQQEDDNARKPTADAIVNRKRLYELRNEDEKLPESFAHREGDALRNKDEQTSIEDVADDCVGVHDAHAKHSSLQTGLSPKKSYKGVIEDKRSSNSSDFEDESPRCNMDLEERVEVSTIDSGGPHGPQSSLKQSHSTVDPTASVSKEPSTKVARKETPRKKPCRLVIEDKWQSDSSDSEDESPRNKDMEKRAEEAAKICSDDAQTSLSQSHSTRDTASSVCQKTTSVELARRTRDTVKNESGEGNTNRNGDWENKSDLWSGRCNSASATVGMVAAADAISIPGQTLPDSRKRPAPNSSIDGAKSTESSGPSPSKRQPTATNGLTHEESDDRKESHKSRSNGSSLSDDKRVGNESKDPRKQLSGSQRLSIPGRAPLPAVSDNQGPSNSSSVFDNTPLCPEPPPGAPMGVDWHKIMSHYQHSFPPTTMFNALLAQPFNRTSGPTHIDTVEAHPIVYPPPGRLQVSSFMLESRAAYGRQQGLRSVPIGQFPFTEVPSAVVAETMESISLVTESSTNFPCLGRTYQGCAMCGTNRGASLAFPSKIRMTLFCCSLCPSYIWLVVESKKLVKICRACGNFRAPILFDGDYNSCLICRDRRPVGRKCLA